MVPKRVSRFLAAHMRRSPPVERFLATRTAALLGVVLAVAGALGTAVALWQAEWVDAVVRVALTALFAAWCIPRLHRSPRTGDDGPGQGSIVTT